MSNEFRILDHHEREGLKHHELTAECGIFPNLCESYWVALWHRQLDYIYGKYPRWSQRNNKDIHYHTYVSTDVEPTFEEYKKFISANGGSSYFQKYEKRTSRLNASLRKKYIRRHEKINE